MQIKLLRVICVQTPEQQRRSPSMSLSMQQSELEKDEEPKIVVELSKGKV